MTEVKIPGKVMLSGEYAVLFGGVAVLLPVDRWMTLVDSESVSREEDSPFVREAMQIEVPQVAEHEQRYPLQIPSIDRSQFFTGQGITAHKLGLGASSAEAVGIIALRFQRAGFSWENQRDTVLSYAIKAHLAASAGLGSGADVAACCYGCPLYYRLGNGSHEVAKVISPSIASHRAALVWSGHGSDTRLHVKRFRDWVDEGGREARQLVDRLVQASVDVSEAWFKATWTDLNQALADFIVILSRCTAGAGIPYKTEAHREIEGWAIRHGGKAKPVGAGAGDLVLVLGDLPYDELQQPVIPLEI